ncbi:MAG TPA: CDP-diacylglycerol--glycerol-3-phosphate 3-phosphatidyltransferase [Alphaproteobacteria bacterium]|nr:CDP-diacylglycerol--glycerol-3-phosphate 3-phosphatidyltransferase [Alphaproteobacteria bacterium]
MPLNLPNLLTLGRIVLILPFALVFLHGSLQSRWVALVLFVIAAATDWFDGYLARRLNQGSPFGRMLDPIADKLLVVSAVLLLVSTGGIAGWPIAAALIILLREIAVSGFREYLGPLGVVVPVSRLAKWKTAAQLVALCLLIAPMPSLEMPGDTLLWIAAAMTVVTGWSYFRATMRAMA